MANKLKQKRRQRTVESILAVETDHQTKLESVTDTRTGWWFGLSRNGKLLVIGIMMFVAVGVLGAGFKYLEDDARRQQSDTKTLTADLKNSSWLNRLNPFISAPLPTSTPVLVKENIYAGGRLLAVEDVNATAVPPADLAVWRPSSGVWYVMGGQGSQQTFYQFGQNLDITVPGDYDGDGKTDFSVFRPSNSIWYVLLSSDNSFTSFQFGSEGDKAAPADYDGDGRTDKTVYRPSNGYWYIWRSATNDFIGQQFGISSDTPAPADYDGDGKADIAVWRNSDAAFYVLRSLDGQFQPQAFGQSGDVPMCGDYDGDGRADFAVRRNADWIIRNSSTGQQQPTITWKDAGDVAVPNDYDGDGKLDIAVWRPTNPGVGNWFIRQSSLNGQERNVVWGELGDKPVSAFYRR